MTKHKFYPKDRDIQTLRNLELMQCATADQLARLSPRATERGDSYRNLSLNLRRFRDQLKYVDVVHAVLRGFPYIYSLTAKGKEYLDANYGRLHKPGIRSASSWKHELYLQEFLVEVLSRKPIENILLDRYQNSMNFDKAYRRSGGRAIAPDVFLVFHRHKRFFVEIDCRNDEKDFERKATTYDKYPKKYWHMAYRLWMKEREEQDHFKPAKPDVLFVVYPPDEASQLAYTSPQKPLELPEDTKNAELTRTRNAIRHLKKMELSGNYIAPGHWLRDWKGFLNPNDYKDEYDELEAKEALELMPTYQVFD